MPTVFVTVDALRADHVGQYGYRRETLPALDELVDAGTLFENAFSNAPYTRISVPSLLTSRYLAYQGLDQFPTVASTLSDAGVHTALVGTQTGIGLVDGDFRFDEMVDMGRDDEGAAAEAQRPLRESLARRVGINDAAAKVSDFLQRSGATRMYDVARRAYTGVFGASGFNYLGYTDGAIVTDRALEWLADAPPEFFLWVHYMEPHRPYGVHDESPAYLDGPLPQDRIRELMRKAGTDADSVSDRDHELLIDLYDSDIRYCSRHLQRLFDGIRDHGLWNDCNVVLTSDHGEEFYEHGQYFHRNFPHDELTHVPLVVKPAREAVPSTKHPERISEQRELLDLAPTICSFHGIARGHSFLGESLFEGDERRIVALGQPNGSPPTVSVRDPQWKLLWTDGDRRLFDLQADSGEHRDVAAEHPDVAAKLADAVPQRVFDRRLVPPRAPDDEADREQLAALGYMELRDDESS